MAMTTGVRGDISSDINVTPMIDVLLVLLIIFMVIVPVVPKGLGAMVPQPGHNRDEIPPSATIVVSVLHSSGSHMEYKINQDVVQKGELLARLTEIFASRAERTMFVKGDDDASFLQIAEIIDIGHSAGVDRVALITPKTSEGL